MTLLWITALHILLTALPLVAATLLAARRGVRDIPTLLIVGLLGSGVAAMVSFWAYFVSSSVGLACSYAILIGSIVVVAVCVRRIGRELLLRLEVPWALWTLGVVFLVFLGFIHGGAEHPLQMSTVRFSHPLPADSLFPFYFGNWIFTHGHHGAAPPISNWQSSDRPPLQMGYALEQRVFGFDNAQLHYQMLGVALQQLWIIGVWALLVAARVRVATRALVLIAILVSDVAIVHGFFVWPKLLGGAFLLAAAALILTPRWSVERHRPALAVLVAGLVGLAILSHGTSAFGLIALAVLAVVRGVPSWRWLAAALMTGAILVVPWSLYQRYFDPPGNRVTKEAFAGGEIVDRRGVLEAIGDSYREVGFGGAIANKGDNFVAMTTGAAHLGTLSDLIHAVRLAFSGDGDQAARTARGVRFFSLLLSLGLFAVAPILMVIARVRGKPKSEDWSFGVTCLVFVAVGSVFWGILLFGPSQSIVHLGSLALPMLAIAGSVAGLRAVYPRLAVGLVLANIAIVLLLYVPVLDPAPGTRYSLWAGAAVAASLLGFVVVAFRSREACRCPQQPVGRSTTDEERRRTKPTEAVEI